MAVFGSVKFSRVKTQYYTGSPIIPNGDDIFVITDDDFELYGNGVEITFNQLQDYCPRPLTIECLNNTEVGLATINIIDSGSGGQFSTSGTFEIVDNSLIGLYSLKHFKNKYDSELDSKFAKVTDVPDTSNFITNDVLNSKGYLTSAPVSSVNGKTGAVSLSYSDVKASPNFSVTIRHNSSGNPRLVKFITVNYSSYTSESAAYFKLSATSCHGNGTSYQFLEDIIIGVSNTGSITCNILKTCQAGAGNVDSVARFYGDVFYTHDATNKIVDFYILGGQWASSQYTPLTTIGNTTLNGVELYSGTANYYSSGDKIWANGCGSTFARTTDINMAEATIANSGALTQTLLPNVRYVFTGDLTSLNLSLGAPIPDIRNKYSFLFKTSKNGTGVLLSPHSGSLKYGLVSIANLDVDTYYDISIENNIVIVTPIYTNFIISKLYSINGAGCDTVRGKNGGTLVTLNSSGTDVEYIESGENLTISATANTGYTVSNIAINGVTVNNNTTVAANSDYNVAVDFVGDMTTISWNTPANISNIKVTSGYNSEEYTNGGQVQIGEEWYLTYSVTTGYTASFTVTGLSKSSGSNNSGYITGYNPTITFTVTASTT